MGHLFVERFQRVSELRQVGTQHRLLAQLERLGQPLQRIPRARGVSAGLRRVELQEKIPRLNRFAGLDMDPRDFARIERFDHLGVTGRVDLTWRGCVNVQQTKK